MHTSATGRRLPREDKVMLTLIRLSALLAVAVLVFIVSYIIVQGLPVLSLDFLLSSPTKMGREGRYFALVLSGLWS
jgi:phosphate transport system permease protein